MTKGHRGGNDLSDEASGVAHELGHSGRKLAGEFAHELFQLTFRRSARYSFTPAGEFAIEEAFVGGVAGGGEIRGKGRYEIRGHEILLFHADGKVEQRLFGDLGRDEKGREWVVIGDAVFIQGIWAGPPTGR